MSLYDDWTDKEIQPILHMEPEQILQFADPPLSWVKTSLSNVDDYINPSWIDRFKNDKYMSVWRELIDKNPSWILYYSNAPVELYKVAANSKQLGTYSARQILKRANAPTGVQVRILKRHPKLIADIKKPSLALQMAAITADPDAFTSIRPADRHPAAKAYMATYRKEMRKPE